MNFIYNGAASRADKIKGIITILLLVTAGKVAGLMFSVIFNVSNCFVLCVIDIFFIVLYLLVYFSLLSIDIENMTSVKAFIMKNELKRALERGEFVIYYQPQVDIEAKRIIGCEALLRWNHPRLGMIAPADFIPLAERTGLIIPIGKWVLKEASKQLKTWHNMGFKELKLSVNISACQFQESDLAETIQAILNAVDLEPNFLELEITENSIMLDTKLAMETVRRLKEIGIKIAIDDFGTGFSSLSYIRQFLADILKIDKSFVWNVTSNSYDAVMITAIIRMANTLRMRVVAEGVETKEQLDFLYSNGCKQIQGYLISPPVKPQEFEKLLMQGITND